MCHLAGVCPINDNEREKQQTFDIVRTKGAYIYVYIYICARHSNNACYATVYIYIYIYVIYYILYNTAARCFVN